MSYLRFSDKHLTEENTKPSHFIDLPQVMQLLVEELMLESRSCHWSFNTVPSQVEITLLLSRNRCNAT